MVRMEIIEQILNATLGKVRGKPQRTHNLVYINRFEYLLCAQHCPKVYQGTVLKLGFVLDSAGQTFKNKVPGPHSSSSESKFLDI